MPEGHTIHRLAAELQPHIGCTVRTTSPQGRFRDGAAVLDGGQLVAVQAHGKHLLLQVDEHWLHIHLGLVGSLLRSDPDGEARSGVRLRTVLGAPLEAWDLVAPLRCELLTDPEVAALLARLGPDPLRGDDPAPALARIARSGRTVGELLLDQSVLAGVGNVYRAEALHLCGVHPLRPGRDVSDDELRCLWDTLARLMRRGVHEGRIVTVLDDSADRSGIPDAEGRHVYKQDGCRSCGAPVRAWALGSRTAYACEVCQPAPGTSPASRPAGRKAGSVVRRQGLEPRTR